MVFVREELGRRDENTDKVKSIGILAFKKRTNILKEVLKKLNMSMPLDVSASKLD